VEILTLLFEKFLNIIRAVLPSNVLSGREAALSELNPDKFYIENVRSALGVSHRRAIDLCEAAVRQGFFRRRVEVMCPDGAVAASADTEGLLPPNVRCWNQDDGHLEEVEISTESLRKITCYSLNDEATSSLYGQTA
jgi:hypothetical protein